MNTTLNEHSVTCSYPQFRDHSEYRTGQMSIRADIELKGSKDIKERIACALRAKPTTITVDRYGYNTSGLAACCSGTWKGKRWFAKILLANPYPTPPRFRTPWEPTLHAAVPLRAITEQIDIEWNMTLMMLKLSKDRSVPVPLGRSLASRTIVWEEAGGTSLVRTLKWSRWKGSMARSGAEALFKSGVWLRKIHEASLQGILCRRARWYISCLLAREWTSPSGCFGKIKSSASVLEWSATNCAVRSVVGISMQGLAIFRRTLQR